MEKIKSTDGDLTKVGSHEGWDVYKRASVSGECALFAFKVINGEHGPDHVATVNFRLSRKADVGGYGSVIGKGPIGIVQAMLGLICHDWIVEGPA